MSTTTKTQPINGQHMLQAVVDADGDYVGHETHRINCDCSTRRNKATGLKRAAYRFHVSNCHPAWLQVTVDAPCMGA